MAQLLTVLGLNWQSSIFLPKLLLFFQNSLTGDVDALFAFIQVNIPGEVAIALQHSTQSEHINQL